jgi:hypothetical protein
VLKSITPIVVVAAFVVLGAGVHGAITQRWSAFAPDTIRSDRMHAMTITLPSLETSEIPNDVPLKERSIATSRRYVSSETGFNAIVSLISGVPGAVSTHTPDVCYTASGYKILSNPKRVSIKLADGTPATYFVADFEKKKETEVERLRVRWAWTTKGTWEAPDYARFQYMKVSELYKLYLVTGLPEQDGKPTEDTTAMQTFTRSAFEQYSQMFAQK